MIVSLKVLVVCFIILNFVFVASAQNHTRTVISLDNNWRTTANDINTFAYSRFEKTLFIDTAWHGVNVPHNWDRYEGYRRKLHGNRHGYAWYRKSFTVQWQPKGKRIFLFFEGVGSYATVWLNEKKVGYHAGGRTTFTIDVTNVIKFDRQNILAVRADHPAGIKDLPWVCGGCSDERGFSEGSQPMGIFRPVHLIITNDVRIEPFGVHIWNDANVSTASANVFIETEIKNYSNNIKKISVVNKLINKEGVIVGKTTSGSEVKPQNTIKLKQQPPVIKNPRLWSLEDPYLYSLITEILQDGKVVDSISTPYGIRWISWPVGKTSSSNQFFLNGKPVFINGIAEYEHLLGNSHAFSAEQIYSRAMQMKAAGFNAFRDAHHPHNLRYQNYWDSLGLLWWTQMGAHVWYDSPEFKNNFKTLLKEWVKERRNSPSVVLWGLQNESKLSEEFAKECTEIIRQMDPTASSQRLVVTCNGGTGTDWDVPQNWTGTYGGNPATYNEDLKRQVLIGEYGAWRTLDLHTEGPFVQNGIYSEDRMTQLMEMKIRLAETVKDSTAGHFMWLFTSHDNPGRVQGGEGYRELDKIGPVNYKGLLTPWEEPLDVYYMFRSNYASKEKEPMVYIVSHTWPDRWLTPGKKSGITVYSNCDEVELFNDVRSQSLGKRKKGGIGTHFTWDDVDIRYNVLYAIGYVNGKEVAKDYIVLRHLPRSPDFDKFYASAEKITAPQKGYHYLYRVNCGGPDYVDSEGNTWLADRAGMNGSIWGSSSWTYFFPDMPPYFASQRVTNDPIMGTKDWKLFQDFRYGRHELRYDFPVQDGEYLVELYFTEPWLGTGGGMNASGWRLFDVAINNEIVLKDLDIWKEVGHDAALKKTVKVNVRGGKLIIWFPLVPAGQAIISAIAIATTNKNAKSAISPIPLFNFSKQEMRNWKINDWMMPGDEMYFDEKESFYSLPSSVYGAQWLKTDKNIDKKSATARIAFNENAELFIGVDTIMKMQPNWIKDFEKTGSFILTTQNRKFQLYKKRFSKGEGFLLDMSGITDSRMFPVMAIPASNMEPAYDLKAITSYKAVSASISGPGIRKGKVDDKDRVIFEKASSDNILQWNFTVGVADIYSLTISYHNPHNEVLNGRMQLLSADGTVMKEQVVEFTPTRPGKSNYITTNTGSMINAGHYIIRLTAPKAEGLNINALDVQ